jgi:hypothetical protein
MYSIYFLKIFEYLNNNFKINGYKIFNLDNLKEYKINKSFIDY